MRNIIANRMEINNVYPHVFIELFLKSFLPKDAEAISNYLPVNGNL